MTDHPTFPQAERKNPFETSELLSQRWRQRRELRCVPDRVVGHLLQSFAVEPRGEIMRPTLVEEALRSHADSVADGIRSFLDQCEELERASGVSKLLNRYHGFDNPLDDVATEARDDAKRFRIDGLDLEVEDSVKRWLRLVIIADDLADDGYRDPRLPAADVLAALA